MKYVLLIYQPHPFDPSSYSEEEYKMIGAQYAALNVTPNVSPGPPMGLPKDAATVRVENEVVAATDGPYVGGAGAVGGFLVIEVESREHAVELAARVPAARLGGAVEIRPCQVYW
ncbi:MAG TPA: YciI family protein [Mesorhizobium sp.]|jgi:hypothetical protein|nr:YciI family protein [Mesorhizobium sp.]